MIKRIPQSDIRIRPFKVYKQFELTDAFATGSGIVGHKRLTAISGSTNDISASLWASINRLYYDEPYNPMITYGYIAKNRAENPYLETRQLDSEAVVLTIPQQQFGEKVKPNSVTLIDTDRDITYVDNGEGQILSEQISSTLVELNAETNKLILIDATLTQFELTCSNYNNETGLINVEYQGAQGILEVEFINFETDIIAFNTSVYSTSFIAGFQNSVAGNIFYEHGIIVITDITNANTDFAHYTLDYKSTKTIFENEYFLSVEPDEFNVSTNPTAYYETNVTTGSIELSQNQKTRSWKNPGQRWIRTSGSLPDGVTYDYRLTSKYDGITKAGFGEFEYSSSVDPTGSYLTPYVTTIGLYDENYDMIAVAKLPTPIKIYPDFPVNFLVRIDT